VEQPIEVVETSGWHLRGDVGYAWNDLRGAHYFQGSNSSLVDFDRADLDDSYVLGGGIGYQITNRRVRSCSSLTSSRKESLIDVGGFPFQTTRTAIVPCCFSELEGKRCRLAGAGRFIPRHIPWARLLHCRGGARRSEYLPLAPLRVRQRSDQEESRF
jgi:hypothetical protein